MNEREDMVKNYITGYNQFDIAKMVVDFDEDILFENIQDGELTLSLSGLKKFREQANQAKSYFTERTQSINSFKHIGDCTEIEIQYTAKLAMDFPNGLKKGEILRLSGRSVFEFKGSKIIKLTDIS